MIKFVAILASVVDLKQNQDSFLLHLAIIVRATRTTTTDIQTDYFTPCACTWNNDCSGIVKEKLGFPLYTTDIEVDVTISTKTNSKSI